MGKVTSFRGAFVLSKNVLGLAVMYSFKLLSIKMPAEICAMITIMIHKPFLHLPFSEAMYCHPKKPKKSTFKENCVNCNSHKEKQDLPV